MSRKPASADISALTRDGLSLLNAGRPREALAKFTAAAKAAPRDPMALTGLSAARFAIDDYAGALTAAEMLSALRPTPPQALMVLLPAAVLAGRTAAAERARRMLANLDAASAGAAAEFWAARLSEKEAYAEAAEHYAFFVAQHGSGAAARLRLAELHLNASDPAAAALLIAALLDEASDAAETNALAARLGVTTGDLAAAEAHAIRALNADAACAPAFTVLSETAPKRIDRRLRERLTALSAGDDDKALLAAYALARAHEARGEDEAAFAAYSRGNAITQAILSAAGRGYDRAAVETAVRETTAAFSAPPRASVGRGGDLVFIVGAPRSGSTLVDQILASHSRVCSTGENVAMKRVYEAAAARAARESIPLAQIAAQHADEWDSVYRASLPQAGENAIYVDKAPLNIWRVGFILALYPAARILVTERDPMDNGLSLFRANFLAAHDYAADLGSIGHYLKALMALSDYWRRLAPESVATVNYDELVRSIDAGVANLLAICGLEPEAGCFRFWQSDRPVFTLSAAQVRRQPSDAASGRWRRYESHLAPLSAALAQPFPD